MTAIWATCFQWDILKDNFFLLPVKLKETELRLGGDDLLGLSALLLIDFGD